MENGIKEIEDVHAWFWTDGNDIENTGVWRHAYDNTEVSFFPPRINCGCHNNDNYYCSNSGDAFTVYITESNAKYARGNYCDDLSSKAHNFICEGLI